MSAQYPSSIPREAGAARREVHGRPTAFDSGCRHRRLLASARAPAILCVAPPDGDLTGGRIGTRVGFMTIARGAPGLPCSRRSRCDEQQGAWLQQGCSMLRSALVARSSDAVPRGAAHSEPPAQSRRIR